MKKIICLLLTASMAAAMTACGSASGSSSDVNVTELGAQLAEDDTTEPNMVVYTSDDDDAEMNFAGLCDFDYSKVDSYYYAYAEDGTAPELAVVKLKKSSYAADLESAIGEHRDNRQGTMEEYSPDQVSLLEDGVITYSGCYVLYAVSEKSGLLSNEFKDACK